MLIGDEIDAIRGTWAGQAWVHHCGCRSRKQLILNLVNRCLIELAFLSPLELVSAQIAFRIPRDHVLAVLVGVMHRALDDTMAFDDKKLTESRFVGALGCLSQPDVY